MGRHRRVSHAPEPPAVTYDVGPRQRGSHRRPIPPPSRGGGLSARAGLLGASAAMAMGAVAVASTVVPQPGGDSGTQYSDITAGGPPDTSELPSVPSPSGGSESPGGDGGDGSGEGSSLPPGSPPSPEQPQDPGGSQPSEPGGGNAGGNESAPAEPGGGKPGGGSDGAGSGEGSGEGSGSGSGSGSSGGGSSSSPSEIAEAEVLSLVNEEREEAGCKPVKADRSLIGMAGDFARQMAVQGFFSHIAPDGSGPWDRAEEAGILDLGGENIARGQSTAEEVMEDWMDSPAHKANILNCEYRTLGVGAYLSGDDGPWWTQNFGY
jgi:uncharacterized protein YkwD